MVLEPEWLRRRLRSFDAIAWERFGGHLCWAPEGLIGSELRGEGPKLRSEMGAAGSLSDKHRCISRRWLARWPRLSSRGTNACAFEFEPRGALPERHSVRISCQTSGRSRAPTDRPPLQNSRSWPWGCIGRRLRLAPGGRPGVAAQARRELRRRGGRPEIRSEMGAPGIGFRWIVVLHGYRSDTQLALHCYR